MPARKEATRILHVLTRLESGGPERRRLLLARHLDPQEFTQQIVCLTTLDEFRHRLEPYGVEVFALGGRGVAWDFPNIRKLRAIRRKFQPHIIHGAVFEGVTMAAMSSLLTRKGRLIVEETSDPISFGRSWRGNLQMRFYSHLADACIAVSPAVERYFLENLSVPRSSVHLIPNGVEAPPTTTSSELNLARKHFGLSADDFIVGSVGRMVNSGKRFTDLIEATAAVRDRIPRLRLLLIGGGEDYEFVRDFAARKNLSDMVLMPGYRPDVASLYRIMNVFALATVHESFGLVIAEAMQNCVPVVATRVGGIPYVVEHRETGLLVEPRSPQALAAAILELYENQALAKRLAEAGRESSMRRFGEERYANDVVRLYRSLL